MTALFFLNISTRNHTSNHAPCTMKHSLTRELGILVHGGGCCAVASTLTRICRRCCNIDLQGLELCRCRCCGGAVG